MCISDCMRTHSLNKSWETSWVPSHSCTPDINCHPTEAKSNSFTLQIQLLTPLTSKHDLHKSYAPSCDPCLYTHTNKHIYILSASRCKSQGSNMAQGFVIAILLYKINNQLLVNFSQGVCLHVQFYTCNRVVLREKSCFKQNVISIPLLFFFLECLDNCNYVI